MSYLKSAKSNSKKLGFALPKDLVSEYLELQKEAKTKGFIFDLTDKVTREVQEAVKSVRKELEENQAPAAQPLAAQQS